MTVTSPKVVPTTAFGRRFRSTTEARWAVFLSEAGVAWEYEAETYDLGFPLGWYLPDFWLPGPEWFLEVKPGRTKMLDRDYDKAKALHIATRKPVLVANGFGLLPRSPGRETDPGWIYDVFDSGTGRSTTTLRTGAAGGAGYRLFVKDCGCLSLALIDQGGWWLHKCEHGTSGLSRTRHAYEAAAAFRPGQ